MYVLCSLLSAIMFTNGHSTLNYRRDSGSLIQCRMYIRLNIDPDVYVWNKEVPTGICSTLMWYFMYILQCFNRVEQWQCHGCSYCVVVEWKDIIVQQSLYKGFIWCKCGCTLDGHVQCFIVYPHGSLERDNYILWTEDLVNKK